jgi:PKD repeat protein
VDSTDQSPGHTYDTAGTYTVKLTVTNAAGSDDEVKTDYITVKSSGGGSETVMIPTDGDTHINQRSPGASADGEDYMLVRTWASRNQNYRSAVHFDLSSIPSGATITTATLHLYLYDMGAGDGVTDYHNDVHRIIGGDWYAPLLTWSNCPVFEPIPTDSQPTGTVKNVWIDWDVTPDMQAYASGAPMYGWVIKYPVESLPIQHIVAYNTLEHADPALRPYLEVTYTESEPAPVAAFSGLPLSGPAPHTVQFTDESTGTITSYEWDFENDGTIDSADQNPGHSYDTPGTYTVKLVVGNAGGSDDEVKTDYITVQKGSTQVPEFPAIAFPVMVIGIVGLLAVVFRRIG